MSFDEPLPALVVKSWKLIRGQGSRRKRQRIKDCIIKHLCVDNKQFYAIMNGKKEIPSGDVEYIKNYINSIKQQR